MEKNTIPDSDVLNWIISPVANCVKYIAEETINASVLHKCVINMVRMEPLILIARQVLIEKKKDDTPLKLLQSENKILEKKAKEFIESDFHSINSHGLIGLWCSVETAVEDTIILILINDSKAIESIKHFGYKVNNNFSTPLNEESARRLFNSLQRQIGEKNKFTIGEIYSSLLSIFEININLNEKILIALAEVNGVRNCLIHKGGIISKKAVKDSPQLANSLGKKFYINNELYLKYYTELGNFSTALMEATTKSKYMASH